MYSSNEKRKKIIVGMLVLIIGILACNLPGESNAGNSSFDNAHLMMFANRATLGLYDEVEVSDTQNKKPSRWLVAYQKRPNSQSSLEQINECLLLAHEYERMAQLAQKTGHQEMYAIFMGKYEDQRSLAQTLEEERAEWRRRRRFSSVVKRVGHGIGQALKFTLDNVAQGTEMVITSYTENYVEQVRSFIRNPLRYGFQHYVSIQLGILKHQFIDKAGPFFGSRAYEVIKVEEFAEKVEEEIFGEEHPQQPPATIAPTDDNTENPIVPVGTYEGKTNLPDINVDEVTVVFKENYVVINVSKDGAVSGNFKVTLYYPPHGICSTTSNVDYDGTFSGELKNTTGQASLVLTFEFSEEVGIVDDFCGDIEGAHTDTYIVKITVQEDTMIGEVQDGSGLSFTATKNK